MWFKVSTMKEEINGESVYEITMIDVMEIVDWQHILSIQSHGFDLF